MKQTVLCCLGDATDVQTWSGTPFFFLAAMRALGIPLVGARLRPERYWASRLSWNARSYIKAGYRGGYQYSNGFLDALARRDPLLETAAEAISHFPLLPNCHTFRGNVSFYIDATLEQILLEYGAARQMDPSFVRSIMERERGQYSAARRVICMSRWAASSVVETYGIDPAKVFVVPAGANLTLDGDCALPVDVPPVPFRLGFVGKDWNRKNLPFVISIGEVLVRRGWDIEVVAAGFRSGQGPDAPFLRKVGFLNKGKDMARFVTTLRSFHFGCLFSKAEPFGLSNVECQRLGIPVLTWDVGGLKCTASSRAAVVFRSQASAEEIADTIEGFMRSPEKYKELRAIAHSEAWRSDWRVAAERVVGIWGGAVDRTYANVRS